MSTIEIEQNTQTVFSVTVTDSDRSSSQHLVTVSPEYLEKIRWKEDEIEELLNTSFTFLLERESKESILSEFDLSIIENYFSEYREIISKNS